MQSTIKPNVYLGSARQSQAAEAYNRVRNTLQDRQDSTSDHNSNTCFACHSQFNLVVRKIFEDEDKGEPTVYEKLYGDLKDDIAKKINPEGSHPSKETQFAMSVNKNDEMKKLALQVKKGGIVCSEEEYDKLPQQMKQKHKLLSEISRNQQVKYLKLTHENRALSQESEKLLNSIISRRYPSRETGDRTVDGRYLSEVKVDLLFVQMLHAAICAEGQEAFSFDWDNCADHIDPNGDSNLQLESCDSEQNSDGNIIFNFYDDRSDILDALYKFFDANKDFIPHNLTLKLHRYDGYPTKHLGKIKGTNTEPRELFKQFSEQKFKIAALLASENKKEFLSGFRDKCLLLNFIKKQLLYGCLFINGAKKQKMLDSHTLGDLFRIAGQQRYFGIFKAKTPRTVYKLVEMLNSVRENNESQYSFLHKKDIWPKTIEGIMDFKVTESQTTAASETRLKP